jgi:hypothetical protein
MCKYEVRSTKYEKVLSVFVLRTSYFVLLLGSVGCSSGYSKYVPAEDVSRQALETALTAWQNGKPSGEIADTSPSLHAVDSRWRAGVKLRSFEILQEEQGEGGLPVFSVRLTLSKPAGQQVVRYVIVGRDPLWVYREDDYKAPAGM